MPGHTMYFCMNKTDYITFEVHLALLQKWCLRMGFIAVKRHYEHSNSYEITFNWGWLTVQRFSPLLPCLGAQWHTGRHVADEVAESSTSGSAERARVPQDQACVPETSNPPPSDILPPIKLHLLQQDHTSQQCHSRLQGSFLFKLPQMDIDFTVLINNI